MPTINATVFPNEAYVLVEADWTDFPEVTHAQVTRRSRANHRSFCSIATPVIPTRTWCCWVLSIATPRKAA